MTQGIKESTDPRWRGARIFFADDEAHFRADAELRGKWTTPSTSRSGRSTSTGATSPSRRWDRRSSSCWTSTT